MITNYFLNVLVGNAYHASDKPAELPTTYYLGFSSTKPSADGTGVTEPSTANNYAREPIPGFKMGAATGYVVNDTSFSTNEATNAGWGLLPYYCIFDAPTGGHLLIANSYVNPKTIEAESMGTVKAGSLELSILNPVGKEEITDP